MRSFEWIACSYFGYLVVACWRPPLPARRRAVVIVLSFAAAAAVWTLAHFGSAGVRESAPLAYILFGYFLSGYLFVAPSRAIESWLMGWDRRVLGDPRTRFVRWPRLLVAVLEVLYVGCFLLPPAGLVLALSNGRAPVVDRYWTIVMGAEFLAFAPLAFVQTRPPWALERKPALAAPAVHRLASRMIEHLTIRVNTFPSGHAAGSLAVALAAFAISPAAGVVFMALALAICVACVVGRYHYLVDVVAGVVVAVVLWLAN